MELVCKFFGIFLLKDNLKKIKNCFEKHKWRSWITIYLSNKWLWNKQALMTFYILFEKFKTGREFELEYPRLKL